MKTLPDTDFGATPSTEQGALPRINIADAGRTAHLRKHKWLSVAALTTIVLSRAGYWLFGWGNAHSATLAEAATVQSIRQTVERYRRAAEQGNAIAQVTWA